MWGKCKLYSSALIRFSLNLEEKLKLVKAYGQTAQGRKISQPESRTTSTNMTRVTLTTVNMLSTAQLPSHSTLNKTTAWFLIARSIRHCDAMLSAPCSHACIASFKYTQTQYKLSLAKSVEVSTFWQSYF